MFKEKKIVLFDTLFEKDELTEGENGEITSEKEAVESKVGGRAGAKLTHFNSQVLLHWPAPFANAVKLGYNKQA